MGPLPRRLSLNAWSGHQEAEPQGGSALRVAFCHLENPHQNNRSEENKPISVSISIENNDTQILTDLSVIHFTYVTTSCTFPLYVILFHILLPYYRASDIRLSYIMDTFH